MSFLERQRAALVVVDVQEAFRPYASFDGVARACAKLIAGGAHPGLPAVVSEQYPKGLGHTVGELGSGGRAADREDACSRRRARRALTSAGRGQAVVCGIETHVCVSQTVHDLLEQGVEVHVPADAVGSRHELDYERGLERMERAGAVVTTVEAALFELLGGAGAPEFKAVQRLIL